jgi:hypothetical protein
MLEVTNEMTAAVRDLSGSPFRRTGLLARWLAGALLGAVASAALGQVPIPMQEQIQLFNSLPPAQQQSLIRELQRELPPAQRQAVLEMLQGEREPDNAELDPEVAAALDSGLEEQAFPEDLEPGEVPRLKPKDTLVIEFAPGDDPQFSALSSGSGSRRAIHIS